MTDKARILFVDDEKRVLNAMRGLFRRDYELYLTTEGSEAVRLAAEHDVDVIVADQRMPGMSGIEVLGSVKQRSPRTVRILLTGYADPSAVEGSINIGEVFRFLSKPCPPQTLKETLSLAIDAARTSPVMDAERPAQPAAPNADAAAAAGSVTTEPAASPAPASHPTPVADAPAVPADPAPVEPPADADATQPALKVLKTEPTPHSEQWQSVTNIVMSETSVEETRSNMSLGASHAAMKNVGVVVFTIDPDFAASVVRSMPSDRTTIVATTLLKVAEAIDKQNAGVLITDFTSNKTTLQKIIGVLKQHRPELVTIAISDAHDTTDMINLINHGQVFRYLLKPLDPDSLLNDINAAVIRHLYLQSNPDAAKRHEVVASQASQEGSGTFNKFVGQIRRG